MIYKRKNDEIKNVTIWHGILFATLVIAIALLGYLVQQKEALAQGNTTFYVKDQLGQGQTEETINVYINDKFAGTLHIDTQHPLDTLKLTVPKDGVFRYRVESETHVINQRDSIHGDGIGTMDISKGDSFYAYYQTTANPDEWTINLWER